MPTIFRARSGMLFYDDFESGTLDPSWRVEPEGQEGQVNTTDRPGWLRITPAAERLFVLADVPDGDVVIEAEVEYAPAAPEDMAGLILFVAGPDEWAGIIQRADPNAPAASWRHLRLVRSGNRWDAYASDYGFVWDWLGAQHYEEAASFGFVVEGTAALDVAAVRIYRSTRIRVEAVAPGWKVCLVDSDGTTVLKEATVPAGATAVDLDTTGLRFPMAGYIQVYDGSNKLIRDSGLLQDIWGGDVYRAEVMVAVYDDAGRPVPLDQEWDFGEVPGVYHERRLELRNDTEFNLTGVAVAVIPHPDGSWGDAWVDVAPDAGGTPGAYGDTATIASIPSDGSGYVWVRVTRGLDGPPVDRYKFGLRITIP